MSLPRRPVVMPDAVAVVIAVLSDYLPSLGYSSPVVVQAVPDPRPAEFVRVLRTGGRSATVASEEALVTIEAWSTFAQDAHDLAQAAKAIVMAMAPAVHEGVPVYRVLVVSGPALLPDPQSQQQRYTFSVAVHLRGAQVD